MSESRSPLDALFAQIGGLLDGRAGAGVAEQVQHAIESFLSAFRLVPKREFDSHLEALHQLQSEVEELSRRIKALESQGD